MGVELAVYRLRIGLHATRWRPSRLRSHEYGSSAVSGQQAERSDLGMSALTVLVLVCALAGHTWGWGGLPWCSSVLSGGEAMTGRRLIQLPAAHAALGQSSTDVQYAVDLSGILLQVGDVETNPGPTVKMEVSTPSQTQAAVASTAVTGAARSASGTSAPPPMSSMAEAGVQARSERKRKRGKTSSRRGGAQAEMAELPRFDALYNKRGKVLVFPQMMRPRVTLFEKTRFQPPMKDTGNQTSQTSQPGATDHEEEASQKGLGNLTSQFREKLKIKEPFSFVLDKDKLEKPGVQVQLEGEEVEHRFLQEMKAALEKIARPDDPPVFLFHNQDFSDTTAGERRTKAEVDELVLHPTLGVLVFEVKSLTNTTFIARFDEATEQLCRAREGIQEEMGDLLERDAVVLTLALPKLRPEDANVIRENAQARLSSRQESDVMREQAARHLQDFQPFPEPPLSASTSGVGHRVSSSLRDSPSVTSPTGDSPGGSGGKRPRAAGGGGGGGGDPKFKGKALLAEHPEVRLLCGSTVEVYTEWLRQLQQHRATSSHAFRGSTDQERLISFKRACLRRCSLPALRPGQSVKDGAAVHSRWLLTEEQLLVRDSNDELLHLSGPPGSGKTLLVAARARRWLREGRRLALAVGEYQQKMLLHHLVRCVWGKKADMDRVTTHGSYEDLLEKLDAVSTEDPVSIILDEVESPANLYRKLLDHVGARRVRGLWTAHTRPLPDEQETALQREGGRTVRLTSCLRCPSHVMTWTNSVREEEEPELLPPPVPVMREVGVEVELICHHDHPQSPLLSWDKCPACRDGVLSLFSGLGLLGGSTPSALSWRDVVVIVTTGEESDIERVAAWLRGLGLPALVDRWTKFYTDVSLPGIPIKSQVEAKVEKAISRVLSGEDSQGRPALHIVGCEEFIGLERPVVLLWHGIEEDQVRDRESQKLQEYRASLCRHNWFQAASRSQGRLVVMAATPSPLLPLLPAPRPARSSSSLGGGGKPQPSTAPAEETLEQRCQSRPEALAPPCTAGVSSQGEGGASGERAAGADTGACQASLQGLLQGSHRRVQQGSSVRQPGQQGPHSLQQRAPRLPGRGEMERRSSPSSAPGHVAPPPWNFPASSAPGHVATPPWNFPASSVPGHVATPPWNFPASSSYIPTYIVTNKEKYPVSFVHDPLASSSWNVLESPIPDHVATPPWTFPASSVPGHVTPPPRNFPASSAPGHVAPPPWNFPASSVPGHVTPPPRNFPASFVPGHVAPPPRNFPASSVPGHVAPPGTLPTSTSLVPTPQFQQSRLPASFSSRKAAHK